MTNKSWGHIAQLGEISRSIERYNTKDGTWSPSHETCYFVSTAILTAKDFLDSTRKHWGIENSNHYVRDVTFQEDKSRIRKNPLNMAIVSSFTLNVLRHNGAKSIQNERYRCSINSAAIRKYKGIWDF